MGDNVLDNKPGPSVSNSKDKVDIRKSTKRFSHKEIFEVYNSCLTTFERTEILLYDNVYYFGPHADKINGRLGFTSNNGFDDEDGDYGIIESDHLAYRYKIKEVLGTGAFGEVVKAYDVLKAREVAVKIHQKPLEARKAAFREVKIVTYILLHTRKDNYTTLKMFDVFYFRRHICCVYELLYITLLQLLNERGSGLTRYEHKNVIYSVANGLKYLAQLGIIHTDLKLDNIVLVAKGDFRAKLIDYNSAFFEDEIQTTSLATVIPYRAPEIMLGIKFDSKIDIWSLGCISFELKTFNLLFTGENEQCQLCEFVKRLGLPTKDLLDRGIYSKLYFHVHKNRVYFGDEKSRKTNIDLPLKNDLRVIEDMRSDLIYMDLILQCLKWDPQERISAAKLLKHKWLRSFR